MTTPNPFDWKRADLVKWLKDHDAYSGHARDSIDQLRHLVNDMVAAADKATTPKPTKGNDDDGYVFGTDGTADPDRAQRNILAKAENVAYLAWLSGGQKGDRPTTPNLDQIHRNYQAGGAMATNKATKRTGSRAARTPREKTPEPKAERGFTNFELRTPRQGVIVSTYVPKVMVKTGTVTVTDQWVTVKNANAQNVFDKLVEASTGIPIFDRRVVDYFTAQLLLTFPKVTDQRAGVHARLVDAARQALAAKAIKAFELVMKLDGTLAVHVTPKTGAVQEFVNQRTALGWFDEAGLIPEVEAA